MPSSKDPGKTTTIFFSSPLKFYTFKLAFPRVNEYFRRMNFKTHVYE